MVPPFLILAFHCVINHYCPQMSSAVLSLGLLAGKCTSHKGKKVLQALLKELLEHLNPLQEYLRHVTGIYKVLQDAVHEKVYFCSFMAVKAMGKYCVHLIE